jgi:hypothetical protein
VSLNSGPTRESHFGWSISLCELPDELQQRAVLKDAATVSSDLDCNHGVG